MKKHFLYGALLMAAVSFTACDESFNDWTAPATNAQENAAEALAVSFIASTETVDMTSDTQAETVKVASFATTNADVKEIVVKSVYVNEHAIPFTRTGNDIFVTAAQLDSVAQVALNSRKQDRDLTIKTRAAAQLKNGESIAIEGEVPFKEKSYDVPAIDPNGYYLLGGFAENGAGWDLSAPVVMNEISEGVYQALVNTTAEGDNWYKFYEGSHPASGGWDEANLGQMGCLVNGDNASEGFIIFTGDKMGDVQTPVISGKGAFLITLDMNNLTYSVKNPVLYMAGDANGWNQVDMLTSTDGIVYTGFMYLNQNGFKFCSQKDWNGTNYGEGFSTDGGAGNIVMTEPEGYYKVVVNLSEKKYDLTPIETCGLVGPATPAGWDAGQSVPMIYNKETRAWEIKDVELTEGEMKFTANNDWAINWGGTPDNLTQGGDNLSMSAGKYDIQLFAFCDGAAYCVITKK